MFKHEESSRISENQHMYTYNIHTYTHDTTTGFGASVRSVHFYCTNLQYKEFENLREQYEYPHEQCAAIKQAPVKDTTKENYRSKYHKLLFLEEMEQARKIVNE